MEDGSLVALSDDVFVRLAYEILSRKIERRSSRNFLTIDFSYTFVYF